MDDTLAIFIMGLFEKIRNDHYEIEDLRADVSYLERKSNMLSNDIVSMFAGVR